MCDQTPIHYKKGDIVWVRLDVCWWPGEVIDFDQLPEEIRENFAQPRKKMPIVTVTFFQEDTYEFVKNLNQIYSYNCTKKDDFIRRGLNLHRAQNAFMEKFPDDIITAEKRTNGDVDILKDPKYQPPKKIDYAAIFGTPPSAKKRESKPKPKTSSVTKKTISHPRFTGIVDDHEVRIRIQTTFVDPDENDSAFKCTTCDFATGNITSYMLHNKLHQQPNYLSKKKGKQTQQYKRAPVKTLNIPTSKTSSIEEDLALLKQGISLSDHELNDDDYFEGDKKKKRKQKTEKQRTKKKKPEEAPKKTDIRVDLLAEWDEDDEEEDSFFGNKTETTMNESTLLADENKIDDTLNSTKADNSCFDFTEEEETEVVSAASSGRKIPRVIPDKRKSTEPTEDPNLPTAENDLGRTEQIKETESNLVAFEDMLEATSVPKLPEVPQVLKCEQNFHNTRTIKFPDKGDLAKTEVATKLTNPKKRFVKSFEDFEQSLRAQEEQSQKESVKAKESFGTKTAADDKEETETVEKIEQEIKSTTEAMKTPEAHTLNELNNETLKKLDIEDIILGTRIRSWHSRNLDLEESTDIAETVPKIDEEKLPKSTKARRSQKIEEDKSKQEKIVLEETKPEENIHIPSTRSGRRSLRADPLDKIEEIKSGRKSKRFSLEPQETTDDTVNIPEETKRRSSRQVQDIATTTAEEKPAEEIAIEEKVEIPIEEKKPKKQLPELKSIERRHSRRGEEEPKIEEMTRRSKKMEETPSDSDTQQSNIEDTKIPKSKKKDTDETVVLKVEDIKTTDLRRSRRNEPFEEFKPIEDTSKTDLKQSNKNKEIEEEEVATDTKQSKLEDSDKPIEEIAKTDKRFRRKDKIEEAISKLVEDTDKTIEETTKSPDTKRLRRKDKIEETISKLLEEPTEIEEIAKSPDTKRLRRKDKIEETISRLVEDTPEIAEIAKTPDTKRLRRKDKIEETISKLVEDTPEITDNAIEEIAKTPDTKRFRRKDKIEETISKLVEDTSEIADNAIEEIAKTLDTKRLRCKDKIEETIFKPIEAEVADNTTEEIPKTPDTKRLRRKDKIEETISKSTEDTSKIAIEETAKIPDTKRLRRKDKIEETISKLVEDTAEEIKTPELKRSRRNKDIESIEETRIEEIKPIEEIAEMKRTRSKDLEETITKPIEEEIKSPEAKRTRRKGKDANEEESKKDKLEPESSSLKPIEDVAKTPEIKRSKKKEIEEDIKPIEEPKTPEIKRTRSKGLEIQQDEAKSIEEEIKTPETNRRGRKKITEIEPVEEETKKYKKKIDEQNEAKLTEEIKTPETKRWSRRKGAEIKDEIKPIEEEEAKTSEMKKSKKKIDEQNEAKLSEEVKTPEIKRFSTRRKGAEIEEENLTEEIKTLETKKSRRKDADIEEEAPIETPETNKRGRKKMTEIEEIKPVEEEAKTSETKKLKKKVTEEDATKPIEEETKKSKKKATEIEEETKPVEEEIKETKKSKKKIAEIIEQVEEVKTRSRRSALEIEEEKSKIEEVKPLELKRSRRKGIEIEEIETKIEEPKKFRRKADLDSSTSKLIEEKPKKIEAAESSSKSEDLEIPDTKRTTKRKDIEEAAKSHPKRKEEVVDSIEESCKSSEEIKVPDKRRLKKNEELHNEDETKTSETKRAYRRRDEVSRLDDALKMTEMKKPEVRRSRRGFEDIPLPNEEIAVEETPQTIEETLSVKRTRKNTEETKVEVRKSSRGVSEEVSDNEGRRTRRGLEDTSKTGTVEKIIDVEKKLEKERKSSKDSEEKEEPLIKRFREKELRVNLQRQQFVKTGKNTEIKAAKKDSPEDSNINEEEIKEEEVKQTKKELRVYQPRKSLRSDDKETKIEETRRSSRGSEKDLFESKTDTEKSEDTTKKKVDTKKKDENIEKSVERETRNRRSIIDKEETKIEESKSKKKIEELFGKSSKSDDKEPKSDTSTKKKQDEDIKTERETRQRRSLLDKEEKKVETRELKSKKKIEKKEEKSLTEEIKETKSKKKIENKIEAEDKSLAEELKETKSKKQIEEKKEEMSLPEEIKETKSKKKIEDKPLIAETKETKSKKKIEGKKEEKSLADDIKESKFNKKIDDKNEDKLSIEETKSKKKIDEKSLAEEKSLVTEEIKATKSKKNIEDVLSIEETKETKSKKKIEEESLAEEIKEIESNKKIEEKVSVEDIKQTKSKKKIEENETKMKKKIDEELEKSSKNEQSKPHRETRQRRSFLDKEEKKVEESKLKKKSEEAESSNTEREVLSTREEIVEKTPITNRKMRFRRSMDNEDLLKKKSDEETKQEGVKMNAPKRLRSSDQEESGNSQEIPIRKLKKQDVEAVINESSLSEKLVTDFDLFASKRFRRGRKFEEQSKEEKKVEADETEAGGSNNTHTNLDTFLTTDVVGITPNVSEVVKTAVEEVAVPTKELVVITKHGRRKNLGKTRWDVVERPTSDAEKVQDNKPSDALVPTEETKEVLKPKEVIEETKPVVEEPKEMTEETNSVVEEAKPKDTIEELKAVVEEAKQVVAKPQETIEETKAVVKPKEMIEEVKDVIVATKGDVEETKDADATKKIVEEATTGLIETVKRAVESRKYLGPTKNVLKSRWDVVETTKRVESLKDVIEEDKIIAEATVASVEISTTKSEEATVSQTEIEEKPAIETKVKEFLTEIADSAIAESTSKPSKLETPLIFKRKSFLKIEPKLNLAELKHKFKKSTHQSVLNKYKKTPVPEPSKSETVDAMSDVEKRKRIEESEESKDTYAGIKVYKKYKKINVEEKPESSSKTSPTAPKIKKIFNTYDHYIPLKKSRMRQHSKDLESAQVDSNNEDEPESNSLLLNMKFQLMNKLNDSPPVSAKPLKKTRRVSLQANQEMIIGKSTESQQKPVEIDMDICEDSKKNVIIESKATEEVISRAPKKRALSIQIETISDFSDSRENMDVEDKISCSHISVQSKLIEEITEKSIEPTKLEEVKPIEKEIETIEGISKLEGTCIEDITKIDSIMAEAPKCIVEAIPEIAKIEETVQIEQPSEIEETPKIEETYKIDEPFQFQEAPKIEEISKIEDAPIFEETAKIEESGITEETKEASISTLTTISSSDMVQDQQEKNIEKNLTVVSSQDLGDGQVEISKVPVIEEGKLKATTIASFSMDFNEDIEEEIVTSKPEEKKTIEEKAIIEGESAPPTVEMEMAKLTDTTMEAAVTQEPQEGTSSSKLLKILTGEPPKAKLKPQLKLATPQFELEKPKPKPVARQSAASRTTFKLAEKIVKESNLVSVQKVNRSYEDFEDIDAFIIQKPMKKQPQAPPIPPSQLVTIESKKKALQKPKTTILGQTIITPGGEVIQQQQQQQQNKEENIFDIDSMPIVLSDQILTPETIETIPIVLDNPASSSTKPVASTHVATVTTTTPKLATTHAVIAHTSTAHASSHMLSTTPKAVIRKVQPQQTMKLLNKTSPFLKDSFRGLAPSKTYSKNIKTSTMLKHSPAIISQANKSKYMIVPPEVSPSKYTVGKKIVKKSPAMLTTTSKVQNIVQEPTGNKIMIVTNNQGQQSRVLLTPAQQKIMGYSKKIIKPKETASKAPNIISQTIINPKGQITTTSPSFVSAVKKPKFESRNKLVSQKMVLQSGLNQIKNTSGQRTIIIKNPQGQTVKKIHGSDDALLEQQVAEQIEAINRAACTKTQLKAVNKRCVTKKVESKSPLMQGRTQMIMSAASTSQQKSLPPLAPISSKKSESPIAAKLKAKITQAPPPPPPRVPTPPPPVVEEKEKERAPHQLVIQDALGNQTTITEGQILALPSETVDGQPQSYMLVTLDETGNLTPLNSEALMSLDPNLSQDLSNMVLQIGPGGDEEKPAEEAEVPVPAPIETIEPTPPVVLPPEIIEETVVESVIDEAIVEDVPLTEEVAIPQEPVAVACNINNGETNQQLIITGDPIATQKFLESLTEGNTELANLLANAEGNILIHAEGQQILINTDSDNQMLLTMNADAAAPTEGGEGSGNPIFASQPPKNQDILAAALADTDVFQPEQSIVPSTSKVSQSQLSPGGALYPINVNNVLETSSMSSPIMTPLVRSTNNKKIDDEVDILSQVPKNVDLPITITDPNISQSVSHQSIMSSELHTNLEPLAIPDVAVTTAEMSSPSFNYSLPTLDDSDKTFSTSISMPLLTEEPEEIVTTSVSATLPNEIIEKTDSSKEYLLSTGNMCTINNQISSLSEPPPDMFDFEQNYEKVTADANSPGTDDSCEIPVQPEIVTPSEIGGGSPKRCYDGDLESDSKKCKFD